MAAQEADAGHFPCPPVWSGSAATLKEQLMSLRVGLPTCGSQQLQLQVLDRLIKLLNTRGIQAHLTVSFQGMYTAISRSA